MSRCLLAPLVIHLLLSVMMSPIAYADFTFFANRAAWEAEATTRGFRVAEEDFDGFPDAPLRIPPFTVGDARFNPGAFAGAVQAGELVPRNGSGAIHFGSRRPFTGDGGFILGAIGGIGIDLEVFDSSFERSLSLLDCTSFGVIPGEGTDIPVCGSTLESYLDSGFIGILFDSPNEAQGFTFGVGSDILGADNLVVAFPVPEPSSVYFATIAGLALGFLLRTRNGQKWIEMQCIGTVSS